MGNLELYVHDEDLWEIDGGILPEEIPNSNSTYWLDFVSRMHAPGKFQGVIKLSGQQVLFYIHTNTQGNPFVTVVAGYVRTYKVKNEEFAWPESEVELIEDNGEQEKIKKLFNNQNVEYW